MGSETPLYVRVNLVYFSIVMLAVCLDLLILHLLYAGFQRAPECKECVNNPHIVNIGLYDTIRWRIMNYQ
jgi:hypothetical protein